MTAVLEQASHALRHNDADTLEHLCAELSKCALAPEDLAEDAASLSVLRRQVLAARANIVLRRRLLGQRPEMPWAP